MVATLATTVSTIDSATFARARYATRFDVLPPGQAAAMTSPTAIAGGSPSSAAIPNPSAGMTRSCARDATITPFGSRASRWKSPTVRVRPIPIMMMNRAIGRPTSMSGLCSMTSHPNGVAKSRRLPKAPSLQ
jgi:hypothetical protein